MWGAVAKKIQKVEKLKDNPGKEESAVEII